MNGCRWIHGGEYLDATLGSHVEPWSLPHGLMGRLASGPYESFRPGSPYGKVSTVSGICDAIPNMPQTYQFTPWAFIVPTKPKGAR